MATLGRFSTSIPRLSEHLVRPPGLGFRCRDSVLKSGDDGVRLARKICALAPNLTFAGVSSHDLTLSGVSSHDLTLSGVSSHNFGQHRGNARRKGLEHLVCLSSSGLGTSSGAGVGLLSPEQAPSESEASPPPAIRSSDQATPLSERPGVSKTTLIELCRWRIEAQELASAVGSEYLDVDGGPDVSDLLRELEWLLDDAVAACAPRWEDLSPSSSGWKPCTWRQIKDFRIPNMQFDTSVGANGEGEGEYAASGMDASTSYGAFGALARERHTDPVNEFAADCGFSCDGIREVLATMAANDDHSADSAATTSTISTLDLILANSKERKEGSTDVRPSRGRRGGRRGGRGRRGLQVLLRMSVEELDVAWKERIQKRRPFQYVVAAAHWRDFVLSVVEGVLIPRPETEQIIDLVESAISRNEALARGVWADLGTGSGAIAISLARLLPPDGSVVAVDASSIAVQVANRNVERYALQDKVKVLQGFWFSPLGDKAGELAGVVSNPPYIPSENLEGLQAEVGMHEPRIALDGGPDGMTELRQICLGSATALRSGGFLALETNGDDQAESICEIISTMRVLERGGLPVLCFEDVRKVKDFAGITRFVTATRS